MNKHDLLRSLEYDEWATGKLLDAAASLDTAAVQQDLRSSFGSLHGTFVHIYGAQRVWLARWKGDSPQSLITTEDVPSLGALREAWQGLYRALRRYLEDVSDEALEAPLAYRDMKGNPWSKELHLQIQHLMFHSMYHRGQIATLLRQLGQVPPQTDFIAYLYKDR